MEGQTKPSNKLKFIESKKKFRVENQIKFPHQKLIAAANNHDLLLIGCEDNYIKCVQTSRLLDFTTNQAQIINENASNLISLAFRPTLLTVARHGHSSVLLIAGSKSFPNCPSIEVYDLDSRTTIGQLNLEELAGSEIVDYAWHPNYFDSIVVLCSSRGHLLVLAINRQDKGIGIVYKNNQHGALTCCWSPKGKNLAVGTMSGRMFRLEPVIGDNSFSFKEVDRSTLTFTNPKISPEHQLIKLRWINKTFLIAVHARSNSPSGPDTVYSILTVKQSKPYLYWSNVCFENQPTSNYVAHLANLTNSVVCATSAAGEAAVIGLIGSSEAATNELNDWNALIIDEEGARIELPLNANNQETHPCGLTLTTWPQDGRPILIFYTNDGLICPYAAMHSENILKLPEFQPAQTFKFDVSKTAPQASPPESSLGSTFGAKPSFYQSSQFGAVSFQQGPALGNALQQTSTFGAKPSFYQSSQFGAVSFQQGPALGNALQQTSTFGAKPSSQQPSQFGAVSFQQGPSLGNALQQTSTFGAKSSPQQSSQFGSVSFQQSPALGNALQQASTFETKPSSQQSSQPEAVPLEKGLALVKAPQQATSFEAKPPAHQSPQTGAVSVEQGSALGNAFQQLSTFGAKPSLPQSSLSGAVSVQQGPALGNALQQASTFEAKPPSYQAPQSIDKEIKQARDKFEFNEAYITLFEELNPLRDRFDEILDLHKAHHEALEAIKEDINRLDLEVLETFYLIEYVKSRRSCDIKKKSIDPVTLKKVNSIKLKLKGIEKKLDELNNHVDVAWEDFVRRKTNKDHRRISSLDIIYRSLATNQKIINALKKKVEYVPESSTNSVGSPQVKPKEDLPNRRFEEFLASRSVVPVRRPIHQI